MAVGVQDMTVGTAKGETPTAKHSQRFGEMHPTRRTRVVSNSEPTFRLQARGWPPTPALSHCTHSRSGLGSGGRVCP
jgi:hypothetical protein